MNTSWFQLLFSPASKISNPEFETNDRIDLTYLINPSNEPSEIRPQNGSPASIPNPIELSPASLPFDQNKTTTPLSNPNAPNSNPENPLSPIITHAEVRKMIDERLDSLRIYVLESDITQAQQAVKSIVELASF